MHPYGQPPGGPPPANAFTVLDSDMQAPHGFDAPAAPHGAYAGGGGGGDYVPSVPQPGYSQQQSGYAGVPVSSLAPPAAYAPRPQQQQQQQAVPFTGAAPHP